MQTVYITKFGRALVPTGLSFDIKDGYEIQVRSKSGLAINQGLFVMNSPGTVDNGYTGEIKVALYNSTELFQTIYKGDKIAQLILIPTVDFQVEEVTDIISTDERGENGFGSTGN
jgi:dUTP pyrophosphatase